MRSHTGIRTFSSLLILIGILIAGCTGNRLFTGAEESISFEIHNRFESAIPNFEGTLEKPISCAIDEDGLIYILDEGREQIVVLSPDLEVIRLIGGPGSSSGVELQSFEWNRNELAVGGGIVAQSVPEQEYRETWHKAEGLLRALQ
jgi:hypothetical protein